MSHTRLTIKSSSSDNLNPEIQSLCDHYQPALSDLGNAQRFAEVYIDTARYVPGRGWFLFVESHWESADTDTMLQLASESLDVFRHHTRQLADTDKELCERILAHIARSEALSKLQALLRLARTIPHMRLAYSELDADPYLLTLRNGTLDLRSGELLPHNCKHYITHMLPYRYTPEACAPIWEDFLDRLTGSDAGLKRYLQRAVGTTLFGASDESTCFVLTGPNQQAQQLFLSILRQLLDSHSVHTLSLKERSLTPGLLTSRLLTSTSSALVRAFEPAILSAFLNHEPITLSKNALEFVYKPRPTLWLCASELPQFSEELVFLRGYMQPIPLSLSLSSYEVAQLSNQLQAVLPAILNWAIEGFQLWYTEAPSEPECVREALVAFQENQDPIARFFAQECMAEEGQVVSVNDLYQAYRVWARASGERILSASRFGARALASGHSYRSQGFKHIQSIASSP